MQTFSELDLIEPLRRVLDDLGFNRPTPIQATSLPPILAGRDVIAQAPTGSGKTAAFGIGILSHLDPAQIRCQALVLAPTRELADQVGKAIRRLAAGIANVKVSVFAGGVSLSPHLASLQHPPHIVVGTPGRILELMQRGALDVSGLRTLVLDEGDRMLDMGFEESIAAIVKRLPARRQSLLFSATWPDEIRELAKRSLRAPEEIAIGDELGAPQIAEHFHEVDTAAKPAALAGLLVLHSPESTVVFCNTRRDVADVADWLARCGFAVGALHGDLEQRDRDEVLLRFANRSLTVLVASDVAARGLDIRELACVVNYELPHDADTYRHRIGRTARAGQTGMALNLVAPAQMHRASQIAEQLGMTPRWSRPPSFSGGDRSRVPPAAMATLRIDAGRTDKLRPGDIVGALTGAGGLQASDLGKIDVFPTRSYVAVRHKLARAALASLQAGKIKGRSFRVRLL
jgi:ATP-independent RNA helicase DbpA